MIAGDAQFAQVSGGIDEGGGPAKDMSFAGRLAEASGRPLLFNAVAVVDDRPNTFRSMLKVVDDYNKKGVPLIAHALTMRLSFRFSFDDSWNFFDNVEVWREATLGSPEEVKAKLGNRELRPEMKREYDKSKQPRALGDIADYICRKAFRDDLRMKYGDRRIGDIAKEENKHVIDVLLDISEADDWKTQWATPTRNHSPELCKEMLTHQTVAGFSDGRGAHTKFSHLGSFPSRSANVDGAGHQLNQVGGGPLQVELCAGVGRRVQGSWLCS